MLKKVGYLTLAIIIIYVAYFANKLLYNYGPYALSILNNKYSLIPQNR